MITFNDLLTDSKYREMTKKQLHKLFIGPHIYSNTITQVWTFCDPDNKYNRVSEGLFYHLQKLKAESEKKAEPIEKIVNDEVKEGINKMFHYCPFDALFEPIKYNKQPREIAKKPPLGITPKTIHQEMVKKERFGDLQRAITRYLENGLPINIEWINEYNELF